ncbi:SHC-transforming protein 1 [Galendromus occidentalis]|uniref:SHC-transforming protein 1 n=1 Tax=Galendromus occidentalis TaxID=34638 RepID=A0AAJ7L561_9ACAR|nr:SHC-transforming protein 1 [Galendromus occidentalis]
MHLSPTSLVLPQNPSSAPSSTALTPELKRPPNQKFVKHLEANLLKNSISDSHLNCTKNREERYIKVPIGTAVPPPRPNVPCPKKDVRHNPSHNHFHQQSSQRNDQVPKTLAPIVSQNLRSAQAPLHVLPQTSFRLVSSARKCKMAPSNTEGATGSSQRTWLHQDNEILGNGVIYTVKYVGCLEVLTSMKSLDFETRTLIAKECIVRVCEAAGLRTVDRKRKLDRRLLRVLAEKPIMEHAGANVSLCISASALALTDLESGHIVATHAMPNISFASGGDQDTLDFVAYVGKDDLHNRACFVLECEGGLAQDVIATIGQAFELRFREFLRRSPVPVPTLPPARDPDYYNDLPGKIPPEPAPKALPNNNNTTATTPNNNTSAAGHGGAGENLIDLENTETTVDPTSVQPIHDYVNTNLDPFDMMPMCEVIPPTTLPAPSAEVHPPPEVLAVIEQRLRVEPWYHGAISREESEALLKKDGDFLVRESKAQKGFVLTGLQGGSGKHLLLIDPNGVVRTKERTFESVSHLINFHRDNQLPIISLDSALLLINPVCKH